eukprot:3545234-Rhodomonas_salina.1
MGLRILVLLALVVLVLVLLEEGRGHHGVHEGRERVERPCVREQPGSSTAYVSTGHRVANAQHDTGDATRRDSSRPPA